MFPAGPVHARDQLRRAKSSRSIGRNQSSDPSPGTLDSEVDKFHAARAAAKHAMLGTSPMHSRRSYDCSGGPRNVAVPHRHYPSSIRHVDDFNHASSASDADSIEDHSQPPPVPLPPISEFGGLDGRKSSIPSSYRRLRKSRSMFSSRLRHSQIPYATPSDHDGTSEHGPPHTQRKYGTLRRSMSFFRSGSQSRNLRHAKSHDAAIQLAREQFKASSNDQGTERRSSSLLPRREYKPFRKTFRAVSDSGPDAASMPPWLEHSRSANLHNKARSLSHSIKSGVKRLLRFSKPPETHGLSNPRFSWDSNNGHSAGSTTGTDYPIDDGETHPASPYDSAHLNNRQSTIHSAKSSESLGASNSRVTSWADSTAASTVANRNAGSRLSMIQEHGNTGGNNSQLTPNNSPHYSSHARSNAHRWSRPYDSQRVYSALVKRIENEKERNPDEEITFGTVKEHHPIPERAGSTYSHRSKRTLRRVPSDESAYSPKSFATAKANTPTVRHQSSRMSTLHREGSDVPNPYQNGNDTEGHGYILPGKKPRNSLARDSSQYSGLGGRLAKQPFIREGTADTYAEGVIGNLENSNEGPDSPSVYSRTTSCNTPIDDVIAESFVPKEEPGTATIFESERSPYKSPRKAARLPSAATCSLPSGDWQQWVNSQMERIEEVTPTRREHYRENAQMHGDEEDSMISAISTNLAQPEGNEYTSGGLNRKLSTISRVSARNNFSRPFNRSPSVRTVVSPVRFEAAPTSLIPDRTAGVGPAGSSFRIPAAFDNSPTPSPTRTGFDNTFPLPESPTPNREAATTQRLWANEPPKRFSSRRPPVAEDAKAAQLRSIRASRSNARSTNENVRNENRGSDSGVTKENSRPQDSHSSVSSKLMVENFLNSRRQQMNSENNKPNSAFI